MQQPGAMMKRFTPDTLWRYSLLLALLLLLSACAGMQLQRDNPKPCDMGSNCGQSMIERADGYSLGYVQFDDSGDYSQPGQIKRVIDDIASTSADGLILLGFTHGWKEDAGADRWSVNGFKAMLAAVSEQEHRLAAANNRSSRLVAGVFLGWPGRTTALPGFAGLTWFERGNAAERIARGDYGDALLRLKQLRDNSPSDRANHSNGNQLILIGHSLGATMLYQRLVKEPLRGPGAVLTPVADLVLLLSPSIPAADVAALQALSPANRTALPPIMAITSESDTTLRMAFPLGRWLENPGAIASTTGQARAMGLYPPLVTHRLALNGTALALTATGAHTDETDLLQITASHAVMRGHKDIANPRLVDFIGDVTALQIGNRFSRAALASEFPSATATP